MGIFMERIFADSNYFVALYRAVDSLHEKALEIARNLQKQGATLVISNFIFSEVVTVLSQRESKEASLVIGDLLLTNTFIEVVHIDEILQEKTWEVFKKIEEKNVSFVDCSTVVLMRAENIPALLTFDTKDFRTLQKVSRFRFFKEI